MQEVEKLVQPKYKESVNSVGKTPQVLFTEQHKKLVDKGEQWMKDTATSCMVVATLITKGAFAAAFTVPGGNKGDEGIPIFLRAKPFLVFAIADALALFSSSTSVLITSRYAEEDFLKSLPRKLIIGLSTLSSVLIATIMIAFSATFFIILGRQLAWVSVLIAILTSLPVNFFAISHFHLLAEMLMSTYGSSIFQLTG